MMRRHGIGMWIVVNEEFHDDPVVPYVAPPRLYTGNRDIFVFVDAGERGLRRVALTGYSEETLKRFFEPPDEPRPPGRELKRAVRASTSPRRSRWASAAAAARPAPHARHVHVARRSVHGPRGGRALHQCGAAHRGVPRHPPAPRRRSTTAPRWRLTDAHRAGARCRNEVITPGQTTVGDVRRWLYDALLGRRRAHLVPARPARAAPGRRTAHLARLPRRGAREHRSSSAATWCTSTSASPTWASTPTGRRWPTCSSPARRTCPRASRQAMRNTNTLQDALMLPPLAPGHARRRGVPRHDGGDGLAGHRGDDLLPPDRRPGPRPRRQHRLPLGRRPRGIPGKPLREGSYISIELNTKTAIPEWDGQDVFVMMEDDAVARPTTAGTSSCRGRRAGT